MKKLFVLIYLILAVVASAQTAKTFDIEGHRGTRGLMPENTIPAFLKAVELGANTLEMDIVISRDKQLIVSHDPWFSSAFSLDKNGVQISAEKEKDFNLYQMDYAEIRQFDVGSLGNKSFPEQQKIKTYKPLLKDVFKAVNKYLAKNHLPPVHYNIEIKSTPEGDNLYHPVPAVFAKMVYDEILKAKMQQYVIIQSFDIRPLQEVENYPVKLPIALLVQNKDGIEKNVERLGFTPDIYSPYFSLIDEPTMQYARAKNIKVIPWTINEISDMENMKKYNLDGIITDYPNRAIKIFRQ